MGKVGQMAYLPKRVIPTHVGKDARGHLSARSRRFTPTDVGKRSNHLDAGQERRIQEAEGIVKKTAATENDVHPWANPLPWFPEDAYLRGHGYSIRYRFRRGPVLWVRNGRLVTHAQALAEVRAALRRLAKAR